MLYLVTASTPAIRDAVRHDGRLGVLMTPGGNQLVRDVVWAVDNGCGPGRTGEPGKRYPGDSGYLAWLTRLLDLEAADPCDPDQSGRLFAVCPDVLADAAATARRAATSRMLGWIRYLGYPAAYVAQDGAVPISLPWDDLDAVFIGGSTGWKLGPDARRIMTAGRERGAWVHMGRVNSLRRLTYAAACKVDSVDGTFLTLAPDQNLPRLLRYIAAAEARASAPALWDWT